MKRCLFIGVLAAIVGIGMAGSFSMAEDAPKEAPKKVYDKDSCCDKAAAKHEKCGHPCCVEAEKDGKTCAKCNPESGKKKD